jgi:hypothetical protein
MGVTGSRDFWIWGYSDLTEWLTGVAVEEHWKRGRRGMLPTAWLRKFPSCRALQGCFLGVSTSSSRKPRPATEDTVFRQRRDTGVTQLPIERFV